MTETLAEKKCTPCRGGIPPLTREEAERFQSQTPNWELREGGHRIERTFRFSNFQEALGFVRKVGIFVCTDFMFGLRQGIPPAVPCCLVLLTTNFN
jgi:hypothetical protein